VATTTTTGSRVLLFDDGTWFYDVSIDALKDSLSVNYLHCEILGIGRFLSNKVTVQIDYGTEESTRFWGDNRVKGPDGKPIVFNSMVDALNYMGARGWEFVQAYTVTVGQQNVYHWLLRKKI
jgi:hypothetical protein